MDPTIKKLMESITMQRSDSIIEARSNFLKSVYESESDCTNVYKELPKLLESEPYIIVTGELTTLDRHPELSDLKESEIIISPASVFEEKNGVLSSVVRVNGIDNHYISDTITTKDLVDAFNSMLTVNPSKAYNWINENTVTYKSVSRINESTSVYTITGLVVDKSTDAHSYITKDNIKATSERDAYSKFKSLVTKRYPSKYYDVVDLRVVGVINDSSIIRPELHPVCTADRPNISESIDILGCIVKIVGMEDRVFKDTVSAADFIGKLPSNLVNDKLRVYDKFDNDISSEFGL